MRFLRRNALAVYGVYGAAVVSGLVVTPIVVHALGTDEYGLWAFIGSVTIFLSLLDLGIGPSIVRFGAEYRGRRSVEDTNALASVGLAVYGAVGLLTLGLGVALAWLVPLAIDLPARLVWPARLATLLVVGGIVARFPLGLFGSLLAAQQRFDVINLGNFVSLLVYAVLVAAVLTQGGGIVLLAGLALLATVIRLAIPLGWVRRELPFLRLSRSLVTRARLRELLAFSSQNFLIHLASKIVFSTDVIVVGIILGPKAAAFYAIPAKLFGLGFGLGTAGTNLLYPAFAELEGAAQPERQRAYLLAGLRVGMAVMLLLALPLVLIPDQLIGAWIGRGFGPSTWVMVLLGIALIVHQPAHVLSQYLIARGRQRSLALISIGTVLVNLALSLVLAWRVGLWGVALSTVVTEAVATVALIPRLVSEASGLSLWVLARASLRPVLPALVAALAVLVLVARFYDPRDLLALLPLGLLWIVACAPVLWRFGLSAEERAALARQLWPEQGGRAVVSAPDQLY